MNDKLELDIPVLLPDLPDAADACLDRLVSTLSKREGVERAHVICLDGNTPAALCIHFDAAKLPLPRLREMVRAAQPLESVAPLATPPTHACTSASST